MQNDKTKILIVDDEQGLRQGIKRLLEKEGYSVTDAENGTDGIKFGTESEFDIAIIDLKMPDYDGISVLKEIRKKFPNTACFIATAYASYDTAIESTKSGAFGYIPKPFTPEDILNNINKAIENRRLLIEKQNWLKEREARLLEIAFEKSRINTIINSISDGILVVNSSCETVLYNPSALIYLGLDDIKIGEDITSNINPEITQCILRFLNGGQYVKESYSTQIELKPNDELYIEATSSPVPHPDGSLAGVVVVMKNITEFKKIEHIKSQFVSMVSHELKAPIAAVQGFLKILSDPMIKINSVQKASYLERAQFRLESLSKMVNDLLDISRIELNTISREIKEVNLVEIIKNVFELFQEDISNKKIYTDISFPPDLPEVKGDYNELSRLFTNLISNAIKYNIECGKIIIDMQRNDNYIVISISDTGIGIKHEEMQNLYHEFYRAKNELTKNISGTGLGLTIVKKIIDSYSGKIEIESEFKKGTKVKIYLPYNSK